MASCMDIEIKYTTVTKTEISNKIIVIIYFGDKYLFKMNHLKTAIKYKSSPCTTQKHIVCQWGRSVG